MVKCDWKPPTDCLQRLSKNTMSLPHSQKCWLFFCLFVLVVFWSGVRAQAPACFKSPVGDSDVQPGLRNSTPRRAPTSLSVMGKAGHMCPEQALATDPQPLDSQQPLSLWPLGRTGHFCYCSDGHDWKISPEQLENSPKITEVEKQTTLSCPGQKWIVKIKPLLCLELWALGFYIFMERS